MATMVGDWLERMTGGIFGAHKVAAEDGSIWLIKPIRQSFPGSSDPDFQWGMRGVATEFLAGRLAAKFGIATPEHHKLFLHQETIDAYKELSEFSEGFILAIEWQEGYDLEFVEKNSSILERIKSGINGLSNENTAFGIIAMDTLMGNADRYSWHIHGGRGMSGNKGNLLFVKVKGAADIYDVFAIDYGLAFNACRWGVGIKSNWPRELFGMMKVFARMGWVTGDILTDGPKLDKWATHLHSFNIDNEIDIAVKEMPTEWHISTLPGLEISSDDLDDLKARLKNHSRLLKPLISSQYAPSFATVRP